jgi:energy-coupling factor transport system ATP-binding protein
MSFVDAQRAESLSALCSTPAGSLPLVVENLSYSWPDGSRALKHCRLQVPHQGLWMLVGSNGSGKSTLLRLIAGLLRPQQGTVVHQGRCALVFQNPDHQLLLPSCASELLLAIDSQRPQAERNQRVEQALASVGLKGMAGRPIHRLSGGQKQRLAIAVALASDAELVLLDEPTALLDPESQTEVLALIRQLTQRRDAKLTALWITHRLEELQHCDSAALMTSGTIGPWQPGSRLANALRKG